MIILIFAGSRMSMIRRELPQSMNVNHEQVVSASTRRGFSFRVPDPRPAELLQVSVSRVNELSDGPHEAGELASNGNGSYGRPFASTRHSVELAIEPELALAGDLDECLGLTSPSCSERLALCAAALVVPC